MFSCLWSFFTAVPFSVISMAVTQALVSRGNVCFMQIDAFDLVKLKLTWGCSNLQGLCLHRQGLDLCLKLPVSSFLFSPRKDSIPSCWCKVFSFKLYWVVILLSLFLTQSCRFLWLPGWETVLHEDVSGEVQAAGELSFRGNPQTEIGNDSTCVSG